MTAMYLLFFIDPNFVSSLEYKDYIFFFFREIAVEYINCGKVNNLYFLIRTGNSSYSTYRKNYTMKLRIFRLFIREWPESANTIKVVHIRTGIDGRRSWKLGSTVPSPANILFILTRSVCIPCFNIIHTYLFANNQRSQLTHFSTCFHVHRGYQWHIEYGSDRHRRPDCLRCVQYTRERHQWLGCVHVQY